MKSVTDYLGNNYKSISDMARYYGINIQTYFGRIERGYSTKEALTKPNKRKTINDHFSWKNVDAIKPQCEEAGLIEYADRIYKIMYQSGRNVKDAIKYFKKNYIYPDGLFHEDLTSYIKSYCEKNNIDYLSTGLRCKAVDYYRTYGSLEGFYEDINTCRWIGEQKIKKYLEKHNIHYIKNISLKRTGLFSEYENDYGRYTFDFMFNIGKKTILCEYDGSVHFKICQGLGIDLENYAKRDEIKNEICNENENVSLLRIRYDQNVDEILNTVISNPEILDNGYNPYLNETDYYSIRELSNE